MSSTIPHLSYLSTKLHVNQLTLKQFTKNALRENGMFAVIS
jgi:hypothetical protein